MKVKVNENCIGCGMCIDMCPEVFEYNDAGLSSPISEEVDDSLKGSVMDAQESCPVDAIEVFEAQEIPTIDTIETE